ncbi:MAG: hypothetical protein IJE43_23755 [Alphaproteobacteria bacterium]|nr:hypothetical protein [Alphaproteobacteria bacterium]
MKLLKLYQWITGTMADFTKPFQNNDALYKQAQAFWKQLDVSSIIFVAIFLLLGIVMASIYYKPFNDKPGRHYKPKYWIYFLLTTFVLTLLVTLGCECAIAQPKLDGSFVLELKIAVANAIYSSFIYIFVSWIWCQFNLPTNAYRLIKF